MKKISVFVISFLITFYTLAFILYPSLSEPQKEKSQHQEKKVQKTSTPKKEPDKQQGKEESAKNSMVTVRRVHLPPELLAAMFSLPPKGTKESAPKQNNVPVKKPKSDFKQAMAAAKITPPDNLQKHVSKLAPKELSRKVVRINKNYSHTGARMKEEGQQLPVIEASWDSIGFNTYLKWMLQANGRLYVGNVISQKIVAEVDIHNYNGNYRFLRFIRCFDSMLDDMALFRPREIVNELLVDEILSAAKQEWSNADNFAIVMLLPANIEYGFLGGLKHYLASSGYATDRFETVHGHYFISGDAIGLKLERAIERNTGQTIRLGLEIMI